MLDKIQGLPVFYCLVPWGHLGAAISSTAQEGVVLDWPLNDISWIVLNQNSTMPTPMCAEQDGQVPRC